MTQLSSPPVIKPPLTIHPATPNDIPAISSLLRETFTSTFGYSMPISDLEAHLNTHLTPAALLPNLQDPLIDIFVALNHDGQILGCVQLTQGTIEECVRDVEKPIELQRLYVNDRFHGSGVGGALFRHVEVLAKERGFKTMWLGVWEENLKAQRAYERFGFGRAGEHDFVCGECVQTDWILMKRL